MLSDTDVTNFSFTADGLTWDNNATFEHMRFLIGPSLVPVQWEIVLEQELLGGNTGVEQLAITTPGVGQFAQYFDEVVLGDNNWNSPISTEIDGKGINFNQPGLWSIPEPGSSCIALVSLMTLAMLRRCA